jgi:hypothetical protein
MASAAADTGVSTLDVEVKRAMALVSATALAPVGGDRGALKHVIGLFVEFVVVTNGTNWRSMLVGGRGHLARSMYRSMKKGRWMTVERGDEGGPLARELKSPPSEGISSRMYEQQKVPKYVEFTTYINGPDLDLLGRDQRH